MKRAAPAFHSCIQSDVNLPVWMSFRTRFKGIRRMNDAHQIEEVGGKLRAMMPWIEKNKLVDKARN